MRVHRVHSSDKATGKAHSPWFFSSAPGRFNLNSPRGTLNCAEKAECAVREALGKALMGAVGTTDLPRSQVNGLHLSEFEAPALVLADFTNPKAVSFGVVPGDLAAPRKSYKKTRAWAEAMADAGHDGIINISRFAGPRKCIFMFGAAGQHALGSVLSTIKLEDYIKSQMRWVIIHDTPHSSSLTIV
ncbi:RES family NAD+ phosphorylase [Microbacterium sp.]|uniref:RES family NAD+ phosphorylase n=1 Tax=Microbacterium sp. TaxID=51671 RepID=UPI0035B4E092